MNIEQVQKVLQRQLVSERTPFGRPIQEKASKSIEATLQDTANYGSEVVQCESCGFVISMLMTEAGCPNCGVEQLTTSIIE